jgi:hypothetical protein
MQWHSIYEQKRGEHPHQSLGPPQAQEFHVHGESGGFILSGLAPQKKKLRSFFFGLVVLTALLFGGGGGGGIDASAGFDASTLLPVVRFVTGCRPAWLVDA